MPSLTSDSGMGSLVSVYFDKLGLERLLANTVMYDLGTKKAIPQNSGTTMQFHRYYNLSQTVSAAQLTEGTAPTAGKLSATNVSATILQFGTSIQISDLLEMSAVSDVVEDAVQQLGEQAAQIVDKKILEVAYGTSSIPTGAGFPIAYSDGSVAALSTVTSAHTLNTAKIRYSIGVLKSKNAKPMDDGYFAYITSPTAARFLEGDTAWQAAYQYTTPENLRNGELGKIAGARVYESTNITSTTSGTGATMATTAFFSVVLGRRALGVSELDGQFKVYRVPNTQIDHANPLAQYSTVGWKASFVPVILNASAGLIHVSSGNL